MKNVYLQCATKLLRRDPYLSKHPFPLKIKKNTRLYLLIGAPFRVSKERQTVKQHPIEDNTKGPIITEIRVADVSLETLLRQHDTHHLQCTLAYFIVLLFSNMFAQYRLRETN